MSTTSQSDIDEYQDDEYQGVGFQKLKYQSLRKKRRKIQHEQDISVGAPKLSLQPLFDQLDDNKEASFDDIIDHLLPDYLRTRAVLQDQATELDQQGQKVRPLTRSEVSSLIDTGTTGNSFMSLRERVLQRKLKLIRERRWSGFQEVNIKASSAATPLFPPPASLPVHPQVIDALYNIRTTPFENSFLSRLQGTRATIHSGIIAVDWETEAPWMSLLADIREHYALSHPEQEQPRKTSAPIAYTSLEPHHLDQVHNLLERSFWTGINVSDSLDHSPERCTVIATYKKLVVGVAILSSPRETYITYLAVKAGWDNARIARSMLYHLIMLNPNKDITLHVSVNSSAMLLYNRFGFKAEEFVAGFYEDYLDSRSRASKNAFRLRLRQQ